MAKSKENEAEFNPVKELVGNKKAERVIWSTSVINKALAAIQEGKPLKASPFKDKNTKLLKPELVRKYTAEEIEDYIKCKEDPVYFASKCFLMTPEGLKACKLRDYQIDYIRHLQNNRFSILLSCRQAGKTLSFLSKIFVKFDDIQEELNYYYIIDNIYNVPIFEVYNLYCKQTLIWKCKYQLYKLIYKITYGRQKRNENVFK